MSLAITPQKSKKSGGTDVADKFSKVTNMPMANCVSDDACYFNIVKGALTFLWCFSLEETLLNKRCYYYYY